MRVVQGGIHRKIPTEKNVWDMREVYLVCAWCVLLIAVPVIEHSEVVI